MLLNITLPHTLLSLHLIVNGVDNLGKECACTCSRVEYLYLVLTLWSHRCISQAVSQAELGLKYLINSTNDIIHNGLRRIIDTTILN